MVRTEGEFLAWLLEQPLADLLAQSERLTAGSFGAVVTTYLNVLRAVRAAAPSVHVHAFSPLELARQAGLRGVHGGALVNSVAVEALTSILIFVNRTYRVDGAGIRITGTLIEPE